MTDTPARLAETAAVVLAEPAQELVALAAAPNALTEGIRKRMAQLDMADTASIIRFGAPAQAALQQISQDMLEGVKNKDVGSAGDALQSIVSTLRGFSVSHLDLRRKQSWWEKLTGRAAPFAKFIAQFEEVQTQIDKVTDDLNLHEHQLLKDIKSLDLLYAKTLGFYDELALYIAAGEAKLSDLDTGDIPAKAALRDQSAAQDQVKVAQELRDLRTARDDLERRVHDLKLTRQVTMQSLPSIRLVQENDKSLVAKINATLLNTVPLWETQLAQAVTLQRSRAAAEAVRSANDLTTALLSANAENLQQANRVTRQEIERGVFDIEAVQKANIALVASIEESLQIAQDGRSKRAAAAAELIKMEQELRDRLASARARAETGSTPLPAAV